MTGEADWTAERNAFVWTIDTIDSENPTGSLEFKCEGDADAFFPVNVGFVAAGSLADVDVSLVLPVKLRSTRLIPSPSPLAQSSWLRHGIVGNDADTHRWSRLHC